MTGTRSPEPRGSVVFFHAHPDDEAIFTGGTMALLAAAGWRLVLVVATAGEQGLLPASVDHVSELGLVRMAETERAAAVLGVHRLEFLGYADSGLGGDDDPPAGTFVASDTQVAGQRLASVLTEERPTALVTYDAHGIYGHPDHVKAHAVARWATAAADVPTLYEATVDREHLHFVETHLVVQARSALSPPDLPGELRLAATSLGQPTVLIDCTIDVRSVLDTKRAAMAAHASQIPETSSAMGLPAGPFAAVYGLEWYVRRGPPGPIDQLPSL